MIWFKLNSFNALDELIIKSNESPQILFKHSTRCSASSIALNRIQSSEIEQNLYILDVIGNRELSNQIAQLFNVVHQSPQLLIIYNQTCIYHASHLSISERTVKEHLNKIKKIE